MQARKISQSKEEAVPPMLQLPKIVMNTRKESAMREVQFDDSYA